MRKKGVSVMIGYVLLVSIVIVMSVFVYNYLRSYVPEENTSCPEEVSLMVQDLNCIDGTLSFKLKNNGRFSVAGFTINGKFDSEGGTPDVNLESGLERGIRLFSSGEGNNKLYPGKVSYGTYEFSKENALEIISTQVNVCSGTIDCGTYDEETCPSEIGCLWDEFKGGIKCVGGEKSCGVFNDDLITCNSFGCLSGLINVKKLYSFAITPVMILEDERGKEIISYCVNSKIKNNLNGCYLYEWLVLIL